MEEWDIAAEADRLVVCGDCVLLEENLFAYSQDLLCCDDCGCPVEPEDTMEMVSLVLCIECWRPPIISGISDYVYTPPAPGYPVRTTGKSRKTNRDEPSRRAAADTDLAVNEGPAQADLTVDEGSTPAATLGEDSQPEPVGSLDSVKATVPSRPASGPGSTQSQRHQEGTVGSERTSENRVLEGLSPAGDTNTAKPASQERNGTRGCLTGIVLLLLGTFLSGVVLTHLSGGQDKDATDRSPSVLNTASVNILNQEY